MPHLPFSVSCKFNGIDQLRRHIGEVSSDANAIQKRNDYTAKFEYLTSNVNMAAIFHDIGFIGDSLMSGEHVYRTTDKPDSNNHYDIFMNSYGWRMCKLIGARACNYSHGGLTAKAWWEEYINSSSGLLYGTTESNGKVVDSPHFVDDIHSAYVIGLGTNDASQGFEVGDINSDIKDDYNDNANTFIGNYAKIIQKIRELNKRVAIFCIIYDNSVMSSKYDNAIKNIAKKFDGVFVIDFRSYIAEKNINISNYVYQGHYNTIGYQFMAFMLLNAINNIVYDNLSYFYKYGLVNTPKQNDNIIW